MPASHLLPSLLVATVLQSAGIGASENAAFSKSRVEEDSTGSSCDGIPCGDGGICQTNCPDVFIVPGFCQSNECACCSEEFNQTYPTDYPDPSNITSDCTYNGQTYMNGERIKDICIHIVCRGGKWYSGGYINENCGECNVKDDPHFLSFDGQWFDFHGTCNYSITQDGLTFNPTFAVFGKFRSCFYAVSCLDTVTFMDSTLTVITITHTTPSNIAVNGVPYVVTYDILPVMEGVIPHPVLAWRKGSNCYRFLGTQGLLLEFCGYGYFSQFYIYAHPSLANTLYGLCGTFNYMMNDDLTHRDLTVTPPVFYPLDFGNSWKTDASCSNYTRNNTITNPQPHTAQRQIPTTDPCILLHFNHCRESLSTTFPSEEQLTIHSTFCAMDLCAIELSGESTELYLPSIVGMLNTTVENDALTTPGGVPPDELVCIPCSGTCGVGGSCKYQCDSTEEEITGNCTGIYCKCCRKRPSCENTSCGFGGTCRSCKCLRGEERITGICPLSDCQCCKRAPDCYKQRCGWRRRYRCKSKNVCLKRANGRCKNRDCTCCKYWLP
ncbi:hypothetical protein SK128_007228 [Halocaridina rubra]|uniref:VWFD domain-containing protein n=1 Tax=Halocaridina rubra TaxID=373956 RepID=A0AAN9AHN4_HALRR